MRPRRRRRRRIQRFQHVSQLRDTRLQTDVLVYVLCQELLHARPKRDGRIHARIRSALVGTDRDEVAVVLVSRKCLPELSGQLELLAIDVLVTPEEVMPPPAPPTPAGTFVKRAGSPVQPA